MYPLNAILISSDEDSLPRIRCELLNRSVRVGAEYTAIGGAIDALRKSSGEKRLVILHMASTSQIDALVRITTQFPGWPVIALVEGYEPKSSLGEVVLGIMRAGATEILSLPLQPEEFKVALDRIAVQYVYSVKGAKVIAVASVSGGCGATTIAINLACEIADRHGLHCILADLSLRMGSVATHLDIEPTFSIIDLLGEVGRIDTVLAQQVLCKVANNVELLAGPHRLVAPVNTAPKDLASVVDTLKLLSEVVVLDVPCTFDEIFFETLAAADEVILIGEQKLPSIRALKMVREALDFAAGEEHLVVNRFDSKIKGFSLERLLKPLGIKTLHSVARDDLGMTAAAEKACPLRLAAPRSPALRDIVTLVDIVMDLDSPASDQPRGLLSRLGRALTNS